MSATPINDTTNRTAARAVPSAARTHRLFGVGIPAVILLAALLAMAAVGVIGTLLAQDQLAEARAAKAAAVAEAVQHDLERAIGYGIPLERIEGVGSYLQGIALRNPDLGFLALTGTEGALLQGTATRPAAEVAQLDGAALSAIANSLRGLATPDTRAATLQPIERDGLLILRVPVRVGRYSAEGGGGGVGHPPAGHVLVGVQPGQVRGQIAGELATVALGALAVLLLLAELAGAMTRSSLRAPLLRLSRVMEEAVAGRFGTLIGRRPRDQVGRVLFAFNAVVFGLHDRRQRFAAHAEEVRGAVFDAEVAGAVERTRGEALAALGPGLEAAPRRVVDPRSDDVRAFAVMAVAAALLALLGAVAAVRPDRLDAAVAPELFDAVLLAALLGAGIAGYRVAPRWRRLAALLTAVTPLVAVTATFAGTSGAFAGLALATVAFGLSVGLPLAYVHRDVGEGTAVLLRAVAVAVAGALLWGAAVGWEGGALAASAVLPALLAALMSRPIVVPRS